jgi:hypothetical protein
VILIINHLILNKLLLPNNLLLLDLLLILILHIILLENLLPQLLLHHLLPHLHHHRHLLHILLLILEKNIPEKHSVPLQPKKSSSRFSSDWGKKGEGGFPFVSKTHRDKKNFAYPVETKPETVKKIYTKPEHQDKKESFLEKSFPKTTENYTVNTKILTKTPNIPEISTKRELIPKGESEFISGDIFTRQRSTSKGESEFISEETSISEDKISNESLQILSKSEDSEIDSLKSIDEIKSLQILEKNDILNKLEDSTTDDKVSHHPLSMMWKMSSGLYSPKFDGSAKSLTLFDHQFPKDKIESKEISIDELKNVILSGKFKFNENPKSIELVYHIWTQQNTIVDNMFELINTSSNSGSNQTGLRQSILPSNCFAKK